MTIVDPDDKKAFYNFKMEWESCYTERNPVKMPSLTSLRILFQYGSYGSIPGEFITALISNDLYGAFATCPIYIKYHPQNLWKSLLTSNKKPIKITTSPLFIRAGKSN